MMLADVWFLLATFVILFHENLYNIVMVASAEEESSGKNGLNSVLNIYLNWIVPLWGEHFNAIGYSRKGLLVLDVIVKVPPVMPHQNLDNSIYKAIPIEWF
jgi:acetylornithine deacetylase